MHEPSGPTSPTDTLGAHVLDFWFGSFDAAGLADAAHQARWWKKDPAFDAELRQRFGAEVLAAAAGKRDLWLVTPRGRLAVVILLDQCSRNIFRDTPAMFAQDARALAIACDGLERGDDRDLQTDERAFLYLPLMHSESLADQERCVILFAALRDRLSGPARERLAGNARFAVAHRDIIARFGRFPHRNSILGRPSTPEELQFLTEPGSSF